VVAVERRRIEPSVRLDRPAVLAEFGDVFRHAGLSLQIAAIDFSNALFSMG
jgi:hypothetical protein